MSSLYLQLHSLFHGQKRYLFPFEKDKSQMPRNGIYILFEKGERFGQFDRIVRVGTHTGENQLQSRLEQHFLNENKNRSILRKNIGRCILFKENHPYLKNWELDITSKKEKTENSPLINANFELELEHAISRHIQSKMSFCIFEVKAANQRIFWETKIISTLAQSTDTKPSSLWLGNYSPKEKIRNHGLWQVNQLHSEILTTQEFALLEDIVVANK